MAKLIHTKLKGFTILEILISLSIGALLIGLGLAGFFYFRRSTEFNQARSEVFLTVRDIQNRARNAVSYNSTTPLTTQVEGYALFFNATSLELRYCTAATSGTVSCGTSLTNNVISEQFAKVNFAPGTNCDRVFFERLTGALYSLQVSGAVYAKTKPAGCTVTFSHQADAALSAGLSFTFTTNSYDDI